MSLVFTLLIFFLLVIEGFGIPFGHQAAILLCIILIPVLFVHMLFHRKFVFPKKTTVLFLIFLIITLISTVFSVNITNSFQYLLFLLSTFFAFLISYNYKKQLEKPLVILIFTSSALFTIYYLILSSHLLNLYIPQNGYQFVYSGILSHNHLGDFLVLPSILCIYYLYNRKHYSSAISYQLLSSVFCLLSIPFLVFSYSRSAYLSITLTIVLLHANYLQKKHSWSSRTVSRIVILITVIITGFFIVATTRQAAQQPYPSMVNKYLVQKGGLDKYKDLYGNRLEYISEALRSFQKRPIFGVGPDNFSSVSRKYSNIPTQVTSTAHSIFLEILVGQGILGLLPFIGLILLILIKSRKNALYFVFLGMLINFQTDYTYQIYSFLLLFFALAGTLYREKLNHPLILEKS